MFASITFLAVAVVGLVESRLVGLALVHNGPSESALVSIDISTGAVDLVNASAAPITQLAAAGDLNAYADSNYWFLGDTGAGTTLTGVDLASGEVVASKVVPVKEIGFVGFGQSIDVDAKLGEFVITGLGTANGSKHDIYMGKADTLAKTGEYGDSSYVPMLHSSTLDEEKQLLYVTVATGQQGEAIDVIDYTAGKKVKSIDDTTNPDLILGMKWYAANATLVSVMQNQLGSLDLRALNPATEQWFVTPLNNDVAAELAGNSGTTCAFDAAAGHLYVLAGPPPHDDNAAFVQHIVQVDVNAAKVLAAPQLVYSTPTLKQFGLVLQLLWI